MADDEREPHARQGDLFASEPAPRAAPPAVVEPDEPELTLKEARFVDLLLTGHTKRRAASIATGCKYKSGDQAAVNMLRRPHVRGAYDAGRLALRKKARMDAEALVRFLEIGLLDLDLHRLAQGGLQALPPQARRWVKKARMITRLDGATEQILELESASNIVAVLVDLMGAKEVLASGRAAALAANDELPDAGSDERAFLDGLTTDEIAAWGKATAEGDEKAAARIQRKGEQRLARAVEKQLQQQEASHGRKRDTR